ncbi:myosin phosphatase Rho-interacting protein isoform X2 [Strongylocentrotus purpuratus]|uniref:PH domain-containing protein n=1 Tax=Strongylocentrotus purpuratus TaxID=7668 RepID=A0A7M7NR45_STRPU|nr:myosin phosphatase Rho-interacting protein isoform X2 [Strongylocentrotus purpuratus]
MSRNRKWQRRCFILYENGELCYSLDYDPNTIPQGVVNMYQCTKVFNADKLTGHNFSMGIVASEETTYVRAETREEKDNWYETLIEYPDINKEAERQKKKKRGVFPMLAKDSEKPQRIEDEQAEAKPDVPPSSEDPLSEIESLEREDELGTDIPLTTARDTTDISTASSRAARKEKLNLRRSHSALEHRPEKYDKKQTVRRTPSAQTPSTTSTETSYSSAKKDREERLNRRHTTTGRSEVRDALGSDEQEVSGKGDASSSSRRPVSSDGSSSKNSGMRSRHSESALSELEAELKGQADSVLPSHRDSLPAQANSSEPLLHRNNNNVYNKDVSPRLSPTQQTTTASSSRKSSISDRSVSPSDSQSTTDSSQTKKSQPPSKADTNSQNLLSQEELQRLDVPKRARLKMNKALIEGGETQSPSKRTIERRRHQQERRNRHTLDGSSVPFPISERKSTPEGMPRLKRSSSDPNLADNEDLKRKEIAETFPGLLHLKNGWLMKRDSEQEDWNKYWFVLRDNKLSHFKDSSDENPSNLAGAVDLAQCKEATETSASRNYGFQVKMEDDSVHQLGAMTSKIRTNWIQAINKAITTAQKEASPVVPEKEPVLEKEPVNLVQVDAAPVAPQEKSTLILLEKPPPIPQPTSTPDVIPTPLPKQDFIDAPRSNLTIDLTSRHRKSSLDSRISETSSPTEREPAFQERPGSMRSKERRSRRSSRGDDFKLQKSSSKSSMNGRSSSTSSEVFETPPSTPTPTELRIEEPPVRRTSSTSTRSERTFRAESPIQIQKIEADSLKSQIDHQQQGDSIPIENSLPRKSFDTYQRQPSLDNENEQKALVSQLETVVKKLSQVELQNQTLHMEVKQARNASELVKHEKEELHDKLETAAGVLDKRSKECETIQSRFEKLVSDYQESEKELSKARSSLKTERDKAVTMIERLNQQIEIVEGEKKEYRERAKKWEGEMSAQGKTMRQLEKNQEESQEIIKKLLAQREGYKQRLEAKGGEDATGNKEYILKLERHQQELQGVNIQLQTRLQDTERELQARSQETPLRLDSESELETELADMRMELSERDEQIEQLSEQLEAEFSEKSVLQKKYDGLLTESAEFYLEGQGDKAPAQSAGDVDLENRLKEATAKLESLKIQLTKEATLRLQSEDKLSGEASARRGLEEHMQGMAEQLRVATEEKHHTSQIHEDTKNLMELLQGKNKDVERLQIEMKRMDADRISLMEQTGRDQASVDVLKQQLKESEEAKSTLEGDFDCVLHSKVDLEESAKQLTTELATVKSELELLREASKNASSTESEEEAKKEAARKEVQLLQAQVEKVQSMYTEDMFKKEQLLAEKHEMCSELERRFVNLQSKLTQKEEALAKSDRESGEKMLEVTQQMEQLGQKVERGDRELKRLRHELKSSQDNYDALELKHMQNVEEAKQQQKSQQEQLELMGRRIQDLTSKLGLAERKDQLNEELLQAQQRNHAQLVEEMERKHRKEMEDKEAEMKLEKEKEDVSVTTAISVLKKAYEEELEKEKRMSQESYPKDVETIMKRHREVVTQMNRDWVILSTKFSEQCKENTMLSKALRAMQRSQKEAHEKLQRAQVENRKRVASLGEELERMEEDEEEDDEEEEEEEDDAEKEKKVKVLEMNLRLRELELEFARDQIETLRQTAEGDTAAGASHRRTTGEEYDKTGAGEKPRRSSSVTTQPESDGATRPKNRRSLSDLTHMFHKSKKGEKK